MSWFDYGEPVRRQHRKGVWLRVRHLPEPLLAKIREFMKPGETVSWVIVSEVREKPLVMLEVWCKEPVPREFPPDQTWMNRYVVFHVLTTEDPTWCCEGDLGRGYVGKETSEVASTKSDEKIAEPSDRPDTDP